MPGRGPVHRRTHERVTKYHPLPDRQQPIGFHRMPPPRTRMPSRSAARHSSSGVAQRLRRGDAAKAARVSSGSAPTRRAEALLDAAPTAPGSSWIARSRPPARRRRRPRGSSSSASGFPRVSATIRSRTRSSIAAGLSPLQQRSCIIRVQTADRQLRQNRRVPDRRWASRTANTIGDRLGDADAGPRRPRTCAEARSSHCASSTTQMQRLIFRPPPTAESARPARPGTDPEHAPPRRPKARPQRIRAAGRAAGAGAPGTERRAAASLRTRAPSPTRRPRRPRDLAPGRTVDTDSPASAVLPMPASPRSTKTPLSACPHAALPTDPAFRIRGADHAAQAGDVRSPGQAIVSPSRELLTPVPIPGR